MTKLSRNDFQWLLLVVTLIVTGCTGAVQPSTSPDAAQPDVQPTTETPPAQLTALETVVKRNRGNDSVQVSKNQDVDIVENDQIALEERGHGILRFEDDLVVELFRNTQVTISDARLDPQGFLFFGLRQIAGSTRAELNARRDARLELQTELATATVSSADGEDSEFIVCHKPEKVTCLVTVKGTIEVASVDRTVTVPEGEAVYVFTDRPLSDPICVDQEEFADWLAKERNAEENTPLGEVVGGWPQKSCTDLAAEAEPPTAVPLPLGNGMVRIEEGIYEVGQRQPSGNHIGARQIEVAAFWIDAYEVTNGQYQIFAEATGYVPVGGWPFASGRENHPVKGVTWDAANAYCASVMKRLPTEAEWEIAGRGTGDPPSNYPWGNDPFADGQLDRLPYDDTYPVGSALFNVSQFGVYDMVGNVWEWVGEPYAPAQEGLKLIRGGRYGFPRDLTFRQQASPIEPSLVPYAGFRCAADQVDGG